MQLYTFVATFLAAILACHCRRIPRDVGVDPAPTCDPAACLLPDCFCSTTTPPLAVETMPQIIMISFDDALTALLYSTYYQQLFSLTNPDGCPIGITFFLSHDYTDYTMVNDVWNRGHEIASHSISHKTPTTYWSTLDYDGWVNEMYGLKQIAANQANISIDSIVGTRAPFLQGGGDVEIQAQVDNGFTYDCTMPTLAYTDPPLFPFTFDYDYIMECQIPPCPTGSYPGYWEVPLINFNDTSNVPCAMLDACPVTNTTDDVYNFLLYNFNKHYTTNKAPFGLFTHASWFQTDASHWPGYLQFLNYALTLDDVYIVTVGKAIEWMRQPTALADLTNFEPWACTTHTNECNPINNCFFDESTPGGTRYMNMCGACPPNYPWVGDPYGNATTSSQ